MTLYGADDGDDDGDDDGGADDGDDDGDVVFAILWNAWSLGCALYNATRRLHLLSGFIRPICRKRICRPVACFTVLLLPGHGVLRIVATAIAPRIVATAIAPYEIGTRQLNCFTLGIIIYAGSKLHTHGSTIDVKL